jgi:predicted nucleic acid-binding protein
MTLGVVVDASVWVSSLVSKDVFHRQSILWLEQQRLLGIKLLAPVFVLVELGGVISRQTGDKNLAQRAIETIKSFPGLTLLRTNDLLVNKAVDLAVQLGLRGADAFYVATAAYLNLPLATYDHDQRTRAMSVLPGVIIPG